MTKKEKREMDVLQWWNQHQGRFPIVAQMARDILFVSVSTIASESAFSTGGWIVEDRRCSLTDEMIEAITCLWDWTHAERRLQQHPEDPELFRNTYFNDLNIVDDEGE